jgi:hypothetical protein
MPHIPGHVDTEQEENVEPEGTSFLMPDEPEDSGFLSPGQIADAPTVLGTNVGSDTTFSIEEFVDLIQGTSTDPNKPLGKNFQKEYQVPTGEIDTESGLPKTKPVPAEVFLRSDEYQEERSKLFGTGEAFKFIYYQKDISAQFNNLPPLLRVQTKNLLANAGLINLDKTYGTFLDAETLKGMKLVLDFSMNNNGNMSWLSSAKMMNESAQSQRAYATGKYEFTEEDLNDFADSVIAGAEARKGAKLSSYELGIINKKLGGAVEEVEGQIGEPQVATQDQLSYNPLTEETTFIPGVEAEEPDVSEMLSEETEEILDDIFAPREALGVASIEEDDTFGRMTRNLKGLAQVENKGVPRGTG